MKMNLRRFLFPRHPFSGGRFHCIPPTPGYYRNNPQMGVGPCGIIRKCRLWRTYFVTIKHKESADIILIISTFDDCDPAAIRTRDRLLRRQLLYPTELPDPACADFRRHFFCSLFRDDRAERRLPMRLKLKLTEWENHSISFWRRGRDSNSW